MEPGGWVSDEDWARAAALGSRSAFERLVERHGGAVLGLLERRFGDVHEALDLSQDVWVRVFRGLKGFRPERSFRAWLYGIALNAARDEGRRRSVSPPIAPEDPQTELVTADFRSVLDDRSDVETALACVVEPFRSALILVDLEQLSYEEAADALGCSRGTVKSRVHRGRLSFRDHWIRLTKDSKSKETADRATAGGKR
jgi:RNA polymerase sigma-70 factor (ECF subfamily)